MTPVYLNRIATANPANDVHQAFVAFAEKMLADDPKAVQAALGISLDLKTTA